jgi:hypothetical protein
MSNARTEILARLERGRREAGPAAATIESSITNPLETFVRGLEKVSATHETVSSIEEIDLEVERYLQQHDAGNDLVVAGSIRHAGLLSNSSRQLILAPTRGNEESAISLAYAGIAETGSLVLLSGADTPVTTNFLPDNFICVLKAGDVLPDMESLWARMAGEQRAMPRSVNLVTGPSRTADVEQIIQMGAHGPRRVHVILWKYSL